MGAGAVANFSDLPEGAKLLSAPGEKANFSDLPEGAKVLPPQDEIRAAAAPSGKKPFYKFSGPFVERATEQFGEDLRHPSNVLPSWKSLLGVPGMAYDMAKEGIDAWQHLHDHSPRAEGTYDYDPAETVGHLGVPALTMALTHGGAEEYIPPKVRVPLWKTAQPEGTEVPSIMNRQPYATARPRPVPITEAPAVAAPQASLASSPRNVRLPRANEIPQEEWDAGHDLETGVENTPLPEIETGVENTPRQVPAIARVPSRKVKDLTQLLKKSLQRVQAAKAARAGD